MADTIDHGSENILVSTFLSLCDMVGKVMIDSDIDCIIPQNTYMPLPVTKLAYTGWPRKNATLTINDFKKTRDRMKKLCALLRIIFFFQQDDTKIVNFDEGVLSLEPFF